MTSDQKPFCSKFYSITVDDIFKNLFFVGAHYKIGVDISNSTESKVHGGEVGQLVFKMHATRDGKGENSGEVPLNPGGYHEPGAHYLAVVPGHAISHLKTVEVQWKYHSSMLNPLTWRLLQSPRIYISKVKVESMESKQR